VFTVAIALALFQLYTAATVPLITVHQRAVHVALGFTLILAYWSPRKGRKAETKIPLYDLALIVLIFVFSINAFIKFEFWLNHIMYTTAFDLILGICAILMAMEAARRTSGLVFPILVGVFLLYALFGNYIPGEFGHSGFTWDYIVLSFYQMDLAFWGFITGISATVLAMFLIFGAFLLYTGGGDAFIDMAVKVAGRIRGGPALIAVISSSMFGTISGSAVANTAATGNFTIPLMKDLGYRSEFAAGVESAASTGGQLAPPIMGAGAFVMAELIGISYIEVIIAAVIPAVLYYAAVFSGVLLEARRQNLAPIPTGNIPPWGRILTWRRLAPFILPVAALLISIIAGFSITRACFWAIAVAAVVYTFVDFRWQDMKKRLKNILTALEKGSMAIAGIVAMLVCANMIVGILSMTGLSVKIGELILAMAEHHLFLALILTAAVGILLGMGMPTTPAYVLAACILGPALIDLGLTGLQAHLFIFYFAILSAITPPVCVVVFTAAAIARSTWIATAKIALTLAVVSYFIPFAFAYEPALIMTGKTVNIVLYSFTALAGCLCLAAAMFGWFVTLLNIPARFFTGAAGVMLFVPSGQLALWALPVIGLAVATQMVIPRLAGAKADRA